MPRQPRIDHPGLLQHVIVRGIERTEIFLDDVDRQRFVDRFSQLLVETGTECYAWALIPNHFHLLLRCHRSELSHFMRRLLTGHAVYFNRRHNRSGHLFQNRYKSIVCEEESYLLELIRYLHLNPLRAGLLSEFGELDRYPWCGHAVLLGKRILSGQVVDDILKRFGKQVNTARRNYRQFVADGLTMGKKVDPVARDPGRIQASDAGAERNEDSDDRILGSDEFVRDLRERAALREDSLSPISLDELQKGVAECFGLKPDAFGRRGRQNEPSSARALFCYLAVTKLRCSGVEVGQMLGIGGSSVSRAVRRGEKLFLSRKDLQAWWDINN
jgi:REP-associated tyrosine transposase